jgi:ring-1,2-phenylacetyl-CoA epoxidase subunit PaaE
MHLNSTFVTFAADAGIVSALGVVKRLLNEDRGNRVLVFCATKDEQHAEPVEELLALKDRHLDRLSLSFVMPREPDEAELLTGALDAAKVRALAAKLFDPAKVREYHVLGPPSLVSDISTTLASLGVDASRVRRAEIASPPAGASSSAELASRPAPSNGLPADSTKDGSSRAPDASAQGGPVTPPVPTPANGSPTLSSSGETRVEFVMDGRRRSFPMHTNSESILDAAARAGIDLPFSCRAGVCSTCRTKLVRGNVEMKENYALEDWELEQGFILACQSHATTPEIELTYDEK